MNIRNQQQQGRRRGRGGPRPPGQGGVIRPEQNARLDNRSRGNAAQQLERFKGLARDATQSGDRITAEYYHQYADHYFRVLNENRPRFEEQRPRQDRDWQDRDQIDRDFGGEANYTPPGNYDRDEGEETQRDTSFERDPRSGGNDRQRFNARDNRTTEGGNDRQARPDRDGGYEQLPRYNDRPRTDAASERDQGGQDRMPRGEQGQGPRQGQTRDASGGDREQRAPRRERWNGDQPSRDQGADRASQSVQPPDYDVGPVARETASTATDPALVRDVAPPAEPVANSAPRRGRPRRVDAAPASDDPFATRRAPPKAAQAKPAGTKLVKPEPSTAEAVETDAPKRRATRRPRRDEPDAGTKLSLENA